MFILIILCIVLWLLLGGAAILLDPPDWTATGQPKRAIFWSNVIVIAIQIIFAPFLILYYILDELAWLPH